VEVAMSEAMRTWLEILFNVGYLIVVWALVIMMAWRQAQVQPDQLPLARRIMWAFALLALGDTGHVGLRVLAYALGGLDANPTLVGIGALATAITVTFFYMLMLDAWRLRFKCSIGWFGYLLLLAGIVRLVIMTLPQNEWGNVVPPQPFSLYRNLPLIVQGLGVMLLILRDAVAAKDRTFTWIGVMIFVSYAFYTPVILFVQQAPVVGMLMIPKTLAYVAIAVIASRELYNPHLMIKLKAANT
jgi:hypothetical protein